MKYRVCGELTVSCWTIVDAACPTEAILRAEERVVSDLCYAPFSGEDTEEWHFENDGVPQEISIEERTGT